MVKSTGACFVPTEYVCFSLAENKNCSTKWKCIFSERMEKMMMRNFATFFLLLFLSLARAVFSSTRKHSLLDTFIAHNVFSSAIYVLLSLSLSFSATSIVHNAPCDVASTQTHRLCAMRVERIFFAFRSAAAVCNKCHRHRWCDDAVTRSRFHSTLLNAIKLC